MIQLSSLWRVTEAFNRFPRTAQFKGFESHGSYDLESSFSDGGLIEEDVVIIEDGVEANKVNKQKGHLNLNC